MSKLDLRSKKTWGALAAIAVVAGTLASAFAWTAGWFGSRTVSQALVGETPKRHLLYRHLYAKRLGGFSFNLPPLLTAGSARGGPILYWYRRSACPG